MNFRGVIVWYVVIHSKVATVVIDGSAVDTKFSGKVNSGVIKVRAEH